MVSLFLSANRYDVFMASNKEGMDRVIADDGKYAFLMESASIQYVIERECKLTQIGGNLDNKVSLDKNAIADKQSMVNI
jgi:ionotropic glutamate receptor